MPDPPVFQFPPLFAERMKRRLGSTFDDFASALREEPPVAVRINPLKWRGEIKQEKVPWSTMGYYLPERPLFTADPWFHGGAYYVQEPSSMFLEQVFRSVQIPEKAVVLDLCAAPGGKTTHLLSLLRPDDLLVSNEVIRSRIPVLQENVQKWGCPHVVVTQNDPVDFGHLPELFDLIVVDAPCSGEGLFRKDRSAMAEWSPANAGLCAARQKRIVSEAWKCLKPGGYLVYSTCTYNPDENEGNIRWFQDQFDALAIDIPADETWNIEKVVSGNVTGYQFQPHRTRGEGFFISAMIKKDVLNQRDDEKAFYKQRNTARLKIPEEIRTWISNDYDMSFLLHGGTYHVVPSLQESLISFLIRYLNVVQPGIPVHSGHENKMFPHPALVHSPVFNRSVFPVWDIDLPTAVRFLQKDTIPALTSEKGWTVIAYRGILLGLLKNLGTRTNNYFPGERRIRMRVDTVPQPWHERE